MIPTQAVGNGAIIRLKIATQENPRGTIMD